MQRATILPYVMDQNEPSTPLKEVYDLPDGVAERDQLLRDLWREVFQCADDNADPADHDLDSWEDIVVTPEDNFGDLQVGCKWCSDFLFVTFVK